MCQNIEVDLSDTLKVSNIHKLFTTKIIDSFRQDISKEQEQIISKAMQANRQFYGEDLIADIALAKEGTYKALIRPSFNVMDQKVLRYLDGARYSEQMLAGIRAGIAITLLELVKDENF